MKKKKLAALFAALLAGGLLTACGANEAETAPVQTLDTSVLITRIHEPEETSSVETAASVEETTEEASEGAEDTAKTDPAEEGAAETTANSEDIETETTKGAQDETKPAEETDPILRYLQRVTCTDEVILCIGDNSAYGATLYVYTGGNGSWSKQLETPAQIGQNGFSSHTYEGDGTTPTGFYELGIAFGNNPNPGSNFPWVDVTDDLYWVDDNTSALYNQLISINEYPDGWNSGEHLIEYQKAYAYSINIEVNPSASTDSTSAIFLHCYGMNSYTLGCIAVEQSQMVWILNHLHPGAYIKIVRDIDDL